MLKIWLHFENPIKFWQNVVGFLDNCIRIGCWNFSLLWWENFWLAANVLTNSLKSKEIKTKLLPCRFQHCLGPVNIECSKPGPFRNSSNHVFQKYLSYEAHFFNFFSKYSKFNIDFKNAIAIPKKDFEFLDNCIWTSCGNFSLLWRQNFLSPVNLLTKGPNFSDLTKRDVFQLSLSQIDRNISKYSKFHVDFKNAIKFSQNVFGFLDDCTWTVCRNFSLFWREYLW